MVSNALPDCWIVSSGLKGCENQCIGVAEELKLKYEIKKINPSWLLSIIAPYGKPKNKKKIIFYSLTILALGLFSTLITVVK